MAEVIATDAGEGALRASAEANLRGQHRVVAFYSSVLGGVTLEPGLSVVPVDDHLVTRGHGVFDTCNVVAGKAYGLEFHLERFIDSALKARIDLQKASWLGKSADRAEWKRRLRALVLATIAAGGERDGVYCRFWMSVGRGDFAITPANCADLCNLYIVVHATKPSSLTDDSEFSVVEATVSVPLKSRQLATLKSNNYLLNALTCMEAQDKTGAAQSMGLQLDEDGNLAECSIASVAVLGRDGVLRSPKQDRILKSTTLGRAMQLVREQLVPRGMVASTAFADLTLEDALQAREVIRLGGGHCEAVVQLNGHVVGSGRPGPVAMALRELLLRDMLNSGFAEPVPYSDGSSGSGASAPPLEILDAKAFAGRMRERVTEALQEGPHRVAAFYSSVLGGITHDPALFVVPVDDHLVTRGHGVFDTCNVHDGKAYGLTFHLRRLLNSCAQARIDVSKARWLGGAATPEEQIEGLRKIVLDTIAASGKRDGVFVRFWMSVGRGDFSISPGKCADLCNLYIVVHEDRFWEEGSGGVHEATVSLPLKSQRLATLKSNNYLVNALACMEAQERTGKLHSEGLQLDEHGNLGEFSIGSVGLLGSDGVLRSPKLDRILRSTSLLRAFQLARERLVPQGLITGVDFCDLTPEDARAAREIIRFGGGACEAVVELDGRQVGSGAPGVVALALRDLLAQDLENSTHLDTIPFPASQPRL